MRLTMPVRTLLPPISTVVSTPSPFSARMLSRQRTRPVTCSTRRRRTVSGSAVSAAVTLASTGTASGRIVTSASASRHGVGGRLHQGAMEGRGNGQRNGALDALGLGDLGDAVHRVLRSRQHHLAGRIVVGDDADAAFGRRFLRHRFGGFDIGADQRDHGALAHRHGGLHRLPANFEKPRRVGQA